MDWLTAMCNLASHPTVEKWLSWTDTERSISSPNEPSVETLERVVELEREVEKEAGVSECAIEGEGQGLTPDLAVAAP